MDLLELSSIVVAAKTATYVGGGDPAPASRTGLHDLGWRDGRWSYLDSYVGGTDFHGQEAYALDYFGGLVVP